MAGRPCATEGFPTMTFSPGPASAPPAFTVAVHEHGEVAVVEVTGELDIYTAPALREALLDLTAAGWTRIVVDLLGVAFLDSTALGVLVGGYKRVRAAGGYLRVACPAGPLAGVFRTTGLDGVLPLYPSVHDAVTGDSSARLAERSLPASSAGTGADHR
jgi:anti-sigma B factor antagonist